MTLENTPRPEWLTFDCYGTLIQWDEGLKAVVADILHDKGDHSVEADRLIESTTGMNIGWSRLHRIARFAN